MARKTVVVGEDQLEYVMSQANIFYYLNREALSRDSKVPRSTINKILQKKIQDPSVRTIRKLYLAIKKKEEQKVGSLDLLRVLLIMKKLLSMGGQMKDTVLRQKISIQKKQIISFQMKMNKISLTG